MPAVDSSSTDVVDLLKESGAKFNDYLQSYTAASVALLGRWPTFVPEEDRYADTLERGSEASRRIFGEPPAHEKAEDELRGLHVSGVGAPRGGGGSGGGGARASRPTSQGSSKAGQSTIKEEEMRDKVERLNSKLRHEVSERSKANDESMRRGLQLQGVQRDNAALQETVRRQAQQLEHAREVTLKLEAQHREFVVQVESADSRLVKERKLRHTWQLRAEKYQRRIDPLEAEATVLKESLASTVELLEEAKSKGSTSARKAHELAHTNERLGRVTESRIREADSAKEERAHAGLQLSLMADRRDELIEQLEQLRAEADEQRASLAAMEEMRNLAAEKAMEERRLREAAEGASRTAAGATQQAHDEKAHWHAQAKSFEAELQTQKAHVQTLLMQDAVRESEQAKLFDSVSELLARSQYLGSLPPEELGMSKAEALQHRDEASRHLRQLREAHALSTERAQLVLHPSTVATGTSMLAAAGAGGPLPPSPRTTSGAAAAASEPGVSPRSRRAQAGKGGGGGGALTARPHLTKPVGGAPAVPPLALSDVAAADQGFESWRNQLDHAAAPKPKASPRGRPRNSPRGEDPARAAPPAKEPASDWEKQKLLELMKGGYS